MAMALGQLTCRSQTYLLQNARKSKSKQPCSLTLEKENLARARFKANKISGYMSREKRDLVDIMSMNHNGLIDNAVYHRYKKLLD